jgi:hypothetical protein
MLHKKEMPVYTISITAEILNCIELLKKIMKLMDKWRLNIYGVNALLKLAERLGKDEENIIDLMLL